MYTVLLPFFLLFMKKKTKRTCFFSFFLCCLIRYIWYNVGWPPHIQRSPWSPSRQRSLHTRAVRAAGRFTDRSFTFAWRFLGPGYRLKFKSIRAVANFNRCWCVSGNRLGLFLGGVWMSKSTEIGASHGILARPFACQFIVLLPVGFVYPGYFWYQRVVWIWIAQQGAYWQ